MPSAFGSGRAFFAGEDEGALAAVVGVGRHGRALVVLAFRLADLDLGLRQLDPGPVEVALRQQVDELAGADSLDDQLVGGRAAGFARELDLDVGRAVAGDVAGVDVEDPLLLVVVVAAGDALPERFPAPRPGSGRRL